MGNSILKIVPTLQAVALAENSFSGFLQRKKRKKALVTALVGSSLIAAEADIIGGSY